MLKITDLEKKTIEAEIAELEKLGQAKEITSTLFGRKDGELFFELVIPGEANGVMISTRPSKGSRSIFITHELYFISNLGRIDLANFLTLFPTVMAPTLASFLTQRPFASNDLRKNLLNR